ncbi:uncharacterized protein DUF385 [Williamsia muralis]|nr:uncharacterized protein DUF385 [Williamsia marianensis]
MAMCQRIDMNPAKSSNAAGPWWYAPKRWMYRDGRPHGLARFMNSLSAQLYSLGWFKQSGGATLRVRGRRSGRPVSLPVVIAEHDGSRYLVSMLGDDANWVHNVREADGDAELNQLPVRLVEIPIGERASILRCYLQIAPGARPHIPVSHQAPLSEFAGVAQAYPVFRIDRS